jgi:hypothetical protein
MKMNVLEPIVPFCINIYIEILALQVGGFSLIQRGFGAYPT